MTPLSANSSYHRRSIRLPGYDYSEAGSYFVTLVTHQRERLFGQVVDGEVVLSDEGKIVQEVWNMLPARFPLVEADCCVIMPDHFHAIITIKPSPAGEQDGHESLVRPEKPEKPEKPVRPERYVWAIHELPIRKPTTRLLPIRRSPSRGVLSQGESSSGVPLQGTEDVDRETMRKTRRLMLLPKVIGFFKMNCAKQINLLHQTPGAPVWLRNYYEHIIRNDEDYERIWDYIDFNPRKWNDSDKKR